MGRASSNKKVARAAKAGGGRARAAGERNLVFPAALVLVAVLGLALVVYARDDRLAEAQESPLVLRDHWHAALGTYVCDDFIGDMPDFVAARNGGNHTHGDGLIHIHPFSTARSGTNATLSNFYADAAEILGGGDGPRDDRLGIPDGETYREGEDSCEGVDGEPVVHVRYWRSAQAALDGVEPEVFTEDFGSLRFHGDGEAFIVAFAPLDAEIPPPPSIARLAAVGSDLGVSRDQVPDDAEFEGLDEPDETEEPEEPGDGSDDGDGDGDPAP